MLKLKVKMFTYRTKLLLLATLVVCCQALPENAQGKACERSITRSKTHGGDFCRGALIFEDNFDTIDMSKWSREISMWGGGNWEFQIYEEYPENSFIQDGNLVLHPGKLADKYGEEFLWSGTIDLGDRCTQAEAYGCFRQGTPTNYLNPATSARFHTTGKFSFTYGQVEVRAKLPAGDWLWPAIWMMPQDVKYGGWPQSGEIDITESRGNRDYVDNGVNIGAEHCGSTMHWGTAWYNNNYWRTTWSTNTAPGQGYDKDYHLYQVEWTPDYLKFSVDNVELGRVAPPAGGFYELGDFAAAGEPNIWAGGSKMAPFDSDFFLILNLAVGGTNGFFPDTASNPGGKPWSNQSPTGPKDFWDGRSQWEPTWRGDGSENMMIDYVRVWAL